mmetsp:Transcript_13542/g.34053  ORF Transcript_13542/g.34053 Transcript_13542/m.34053 type:complete len:282 (+) Transcript_13542:1703-2548(+)
MGGLRFLFLVRHLRAPVIDLLGHLFEALFARGIVWIDFQSLFIGFHRLVVFLKGHFDVTLSTPGLGVQRIQLQSLLDLRLGTIKIHDFRQSRTEIVANRSIVGSPLDGFLVLLDGLREILFPKEIVSALLGLLRFGFVLVVELVLFLLFQLERFQESLCVLVVGLQLCRLAHFNGLAKVLFLLVGLGTPRQSLGPVFKGRHVFLSNLDCFLAFLNDSVVFFLGKIDGGLVQQKGHTGWIDFKGRVVGFQCLGKLFLFVKFVSFFLFQFGLLLCLLLFAFLR